MTTSQHDTETRLCPACEATLPATDGKVVVIWVEDDVTVEQIHTADCPDHRAWHAQLMEAQARQEQERGRLDRTEPEA